MDMMNKARFAKLINIIQKRKIDKKEGLDNFIHHMKLTKDYKKGCDLIANGW